jgi:hypothetical protein
MSSRPCWAYTAASSRRGDPPRSALAFGSFYGLLKRLFFKLLSTASLSMSHAGDLHTGLPGKTMARLLADVEQQDQSASVVMPPRNVHTGTLCLDGSDSYASYHLRLRATVALLGPPLLGSTYTTCPG